MTTQTNQPKPEDTQLFQELLTYLKNTLIYPAQLDLVKQKILEIGQKCINEKKIIDFDEVVTFMNGKIYNKYQKDVLNEILKFIELCVGEKNLAISWMKDNGIKTDNEIDIEGAFQLITLFGKNDKTLKAIKILQETKNYYWNQGYEDCEDRNGTYYTPTF